VSMERGCARGFTPACVNVKRIAVGGPVESSPPTLDDYPIILRGSKGAVTDRTPAALHALACREGWSQSCSL